MGVMKGVIGKYGLKRWVVQTYVRNKYLSHWEGDKIEG